MLVYKDRPQVTEERAGYVLSRYQFPGRAMVELEAAAMLKHLDEEIITAVVKDGIDCGSFLDLPWEDCVAIYNSLALGFPPAGGRG